MMMIVSMIAFLYCFLEAEGKQVEATLNVKYPGNVMFVRCDMTSEEDIKVIQNYSYSNSY